MKYRSKKGTVINIPDGLSPKQIAAIKADADAGYGTRAQETANRLGKKAQNKPAQPAPGQPGAAPTLEEDFNARSYLELNPDVAREAQRLKGEGDPRTVEQIAADHWMNNGRSEGRKWDRPFQDPGGAVEKGTVSPSGTVDPVAAADDVSKAETNDINTNFNLSQPRIITDENGNTREVIRNPDGTVTVKDTAGGISKTFKDLATAAAETFNGDVSRQRAEEATYNTLTKYYDRDMAKEMEDSKQELANRGIPYNPEAAQDPNTKDLYGRTVGGISSKYRALKDDASQKAVLAGNEAYRTDSTARDSFLRALMEGASTFGGKFGPYNNTVSTDSSADTKDILTLSAAQYMAKYGVDKDTYTKKLAIAKQGSGGGGGGSGSGDSAGFEIVG